ncbi:protein mini spindles [Ischnura elegans]|uniref:protein mini spindles n=1 Tax=Ischnura elegans TaxID=197161 RepID=UPI001ED8B558|nr:protein mini spindles [Ischnura elegans]
MEDDKEFIKLPVEERCVHKLWKARIHGYEEAIKTFQQIDDEKSPEWNKYLGLLKKFVVDSHAAAQEKGLEAVLAYVENSAAAGKTVGEVMSGIVAKCIGAPKAKTKDLAVQITLMYIEIEKIEQVIDELIKGMDQKNPKVVAACVGAATLALREFGSKVITVKPLVKKIAALLEDRDKTVREEGKALVIEIYRWIGDALKPQLSSLKPIQISELETEFEKVKGSKPVPTRYIRSQQKKQAMAAAESGGVGGGDAGDDEVDGDVPEVDPYDMLDPVDILSKLPKDFYEKLEAKKWQERKEAVDQLEQILVSSPKLENGDYGDLVRALKKVIGKDSNVMVVAVACKCLGGIASGLKKRFQTYASACIPSLLEKFREKKQNVVLALRDAIDAVAQSTSLENMQEDVIAALDNKNPSVKAETAAFLARLFTRCTPVVLTKKTVKVFITPLLKTLNEPDPTVRDNSAEAIGTLLKAAGEKVVMPFLTDVDALKMAKIKECCEKAVIVAKVPKKVERPTTAPAKGPPAGAPKAGSAAPVPVKRPQTAGAPVKKGAVPKKATTVKGKGAKSGAGGTTVAAAIVEITEKEISQEEADERAAEIFSSEILAGLADANWKTRLAMVEQFTQELNKMSKEEIQTQVLLRTLDKKPGLRDSNVQVAKARLEALKILVDNSKFSRTCVELCISAVTERLGEAKLGPVASDVLTAMAESTSFDFVAPLVLDSAFALRSPKIHQESLSWLNGALKEFGLTFPAKHIVDSLKKALNATNPAVRNNALMLLGTLSLYVGGNLRSFFSDEKAAIIQQIDAEIDKHAGERPPTPTRGQIKSSQATTNGVLEEEEVADNDGEDYQEDVDEDMDDQEVPLQSAQPEQQLPRQDVSHHFTEELANELRDKNWKVRNEALQKIYNIVSETKSITPNLGELPAALAQRLVDSNKIIAVTALQLAQELAVAIGPRCKLHARTLVPGMLQGLGDNKASVRQAALSCLRAWGENCGVKEFFEGEMILDALKSGNPQLRSELWLWMREKLTEVKSLPKEELAGCLPILYACVEDRNADVRKNAQEAILPFMMHVGYDSMARNAGKLKPGSNKLVMPLLTKASASLPPPPAPTSRGDAGKNKGGSGQPAPLASSRVASSTMTRKKVAVVSPAVSSVGIGKGAGGRRKEEEADSSPLLQANNLKSQRVSDEQKLKVLKWNFTTPREEFVELLRDQMTTANVNRGVMNNMFHADFKFHLKAIDSLNDDLPINPDALVANLDLILKWMTLRFFDTNPSVLLKGLEYLQSVFGLLIEEEYNMLEYEASSFIPYLILKVGDPKDAVRNSVRALFKQIGLIYPVSKLFAYVMEGLKSKNARQRTECLDELGSLIENYGISVCQPTPAAALKEVAKQISDRDNSVRNAALNCVVRAYFLEGERVYKMVGQISDKDMSLLEERIKRAAKNRPPPANRLVVVPDNVPKRQKPLISQQAPQQVTTKQSGLKAKAISQEDILQDDPPPQQEPTPIVKVSPKVRPISGPFHLDYDLLERMGDEPIEVSKVAPQLVKHDLEGILDDPAPTYLKTKELSPRLQTPGLPLSLVKLSPSPRREEVQHLDLIISQIANPESNSCQSALLQVDNLLHSEKAESLLGHVDQLVVAVTMQMRLLHSSSSSKLGNHYQAEEATSQTYSQILAVLMSLFSHQSLACKVSRDVLRDLIWNLISVLHDGRIEMLNDGVNFCRAINVLVVRIIERSDHTSLTCALIRSLHDSVESPGMPPKFLELIQKCLWKVAKLLPDWEDDMCLDIVLYDIHKFLMAFPKKMWKDRQSDLPFRTVRTVVHHLYKVKGRAIMSHLGRIENLRDSELHEYLIKLMKMEEKEGRPAGGGAAAKEGKTGGRISKNTHAILSEIFNKIGSKSQTKEGLALLYDFKLQHPEADVEPFLSKSSQFFQDYIERGLRLIEVERRRAGATEMNANALLEGSANSKASSMCSSIGVLSSPDMKGFITPGDRGQAPVGMPEDSVSSGQPQRNPQYFLERLRQLQAQAGIDPMEIAEGGKSASIGSQEIISTKITSHRQHVVHQEDNRGSIDENLNHRLHNNEQLGLARALPRSRSTDENVGNAAEVDALRKRLEKLTGGIQR